MWSMATFRESAVLESLHLEASHPLISGRIVCFPPHPLCSMTALTLHDAAQANLGRLDAVQWPIRSLVDFDHETSKYLVQWEDSELATQNEDWRLSATIDSSPLANDVASYWVAGDTMYIRWRYSWIQLEDLRQCVSLVHDYWQQDYLWDETSGYVEVSS